MNMFRERGNRFYKIVKEQRKFREELFSRMISENPNIGTAEAQEILKKEGLFAPLHTVNHWLRYYKEQNDKKD